MDAINNSKKLRAIPYGRSQIGPKEKDKIKEYYRKYRRDEKYGKRPDILVFDIETYTEISDQLPEDPTTTPEDELEDIVKESLCAIEAENSMWYAKKMPDYGKKPPFKSKKLTLPRIWIKEEDVSRLLEWEKYYKKKIWVIQVLMDEAFMASLDWVMTQVKKIEEKAGLKGIKSSKIQREIGIIIEHQAYSDSATGYSTTKIVYTVPHSIAVKFGEIVEEAKLSPDIIIEDNGHIIPYTRFVGGKLRINNAAIEAMIKGEMPNQSYNLTKYI